MLKHVQISPLRNRSDSLSIRSSISCASSICGSPEPPSEIQRTPSRASSYSSLSDTLPQTTIKVFTSCLKIDIEYKTLGVQWDTTAKEVIGQLLRRLKMRHRDPRLFYLSMEVTVRSAGVKTILVLDDEARPAILQACHPKGDSRFCLQLKPGGLVRVHTSVLQPSSQYKCLVISEETTSDELLSLLISSYNSMEPVEQFSLYEVCTGQEYQRKLHPDDLPLKSQQERIRKGETCHFLVRRNPNYPRRRQLLPSLNEACPDLHSYKMDDVCNDTIKLATQTHTTLSPTLECTKCKNTFKSCEFCNKNTAMNQTTIVTPKQLQMQTYNPVYNIREIRTSSHSFSSLGIDKKILDIQLSQRMSSLMLTSSSAPSLPSSITVRPRSVHLGSRTKRIDDSQSDFNGNMATTPTTSFGGEAVKNNPSKGLGHFVYI